MAALPCLATCISHKRPILINSFLTCHCLSLNFFCAGTEEPMLCVCAYSVSSVVSDSLQPHGLQPASFLCLRDYPGKNTGVGCHFLLQGIFPTQELNSGLLYLLPWQAGSLPLSHQGRQPNFYEVQKRILWF